MRFFSILLLFGVFSVSYGAKKDIDMRAGCLLGAIRHADHLVASLSTLHKFFSEVQAGKLDQKYDTDKQLPDDALGWARLRREIADSLSRNNKFKKNKGKDLALFVAQQWGMTLWGKKGYRPPLKLFLDPQMMTISGKRLYPEKWGFLDSAYHCGQMFEDLVRMYWEDNRIASVMLSVVSALDRQDKKPRG